jgi:hypothetical protein
MRRLVTAILVSLLAVPALAQQQGGSGGGGTPGGSPGQIQYNNSSSFGGLSLGDLTNSSGTINVTGLNGSTLTTYFASPPAIGGTSPAAGSFNGVTDTALSSSGAVCTNTSGVLAVCGTSYNAIFNNVAANGYLKGGSIYNNSTGHLWVSGTAPTCTSGCTIVTTNGTWAFTVTPTGGGYAFTISLPNANTGWYCQANDTTIKSSSMASIQQQPVTANNSATLNAYNDVMGAGTFGSSDTVQVSCVAY